MMALAAVFDLETHQYDVQNAFPHCDLDEVVYCECPDGYSKPGMSIHLLKALYGLRRSPKLWDKKLVAKLIQLGMHQVSEEPCLYEWVFILSFFCWWYYHNVPSWKSISGNFIYGITRGNVRCEGYGRVEMVLGVRVIRDRPNRKLWLPMSIK